MLSTLQALCEGNPLVTDGSPSQRTSNAEFSCFHCCPEKAVEQTLESLVFWDVITIMWYCSNGLGPWHKTSIKMLEWKKNARKSITTLYSIPTLQWHHNECNGISNHRHLECLLNRLFSCRLNKTLKLCISGLCEGNPMVTGGFPSQRASYVENVSMWWRHHVTEVTYVSQIRFPQFSSHKFRLWWHHQMETFSALLVICAGNTPVPGEFPAQRPMTRSFDVFFDLCPNKRLSKQSRRWWFEMPLHPLWRHCNGSMRSLVLMQYYNSLFILQMKCHVKSICTVIFKQ